MLLMIRRIAVLIIGRTRAAGSLVDPLVYKLPKQQGNITEYEEVEKLEIGMNKAQVRFIMGTPMTVNSFDKERWDYTYVYKSAKGDVTRNMLTLYFTDGRLSKIDGEPLVKRQDEDASGQS